MTGQTPEEPVVPAHDHHHVREEMPRWVPVTIGVVLVTLAALAVLTGLRYRDQSLVSMIRPRHTQPRSVPSPSGEPEPGASLVLGDGHVPVANAPEGGNSHAEITGGEGGVNAIVKMWARRGMKLNVTPPDTLVYVNDMPVGVASQLDSDDEIYDFAEPGSYTVKLVSPGHKEREFIVTASENAPDEIATIAARLTPE
jgi:hypothetical protein